MTRLEWGENSDRSYDVGVDQGVLYPTSGFGVAWNGLVSVKEDSSESESESYYIDGVKYINRQRLGRFSATIEAFTYPYEFEEYDGSLDLLTAQSRKSFDFSYRTRIGTSGYKIHLVYNAVVSPTTKDYASVSDTIEADLFTWEISTRPIPIPGVRPSAHVIIDTTKAHPWTVIELEDILYGNETTEPSLPSIDEVIAIFEGNAVLIVTDHGDGSFTVTGPESAIQMIDATTFQITWDSAVFIDTVSYTISSL